MKVLWHSITILMLALMLPASVCCFDVINNVVPGAATCCDETPHGEDEPAYPESECPSETLSHSQLPKIAQALDHIVSGLFEPFLISPYGCADRETTWTGSSLEQTAAPPDIGKRWAFVSRAALPVRAPSLVA